MATKNKGVIGSRWIFMLVIYTIILGRVDGVQKLDKNRFRPNMKGTIKTIEVPEDGDMIDCVDIYKQPAFDKLHIKDLKMAPSNSYLSLFNKTNDPQPKLIQNWHKYGECPKGTIPIRRTWINDTNHRKIPNYIDRTKREYATAFQMGSIYHGGGAVFNIWNPKIQVGSQEFSSSQMWLVSSRHPPLNTIEVGLTVHPVHYQDLHTRIFIYWTSDGYNNTGCFNLECRRGFLQTDDSIVLGGVIRTISVYDGEQHEMFINVIRDLETNNWYLYVNNKQIGFFPHYLFTSLHLGADHMVEFGGEIRNLKIGNRHTTTQMGSGHFPEVFKKSSYIRNIMVINNNHKIVDASLNFQVTKPSCYSLDFGPPETVWKSHFYFGGPGYSPQYCP